jgi:predicted ATP-dependent endonuclease of OLD family
MLKHISNDEKAILLTSDMEPKITHLERIEIKNLWGEVDIDWQLDPLVNILIGINGSGKTTILELVDSIVQGKKIKTVFDFSHIKLFLSLERKAVRWIIKFGAVPQWGLSMIG